METNLRFINIPQDTDPVPHFTQLALFTSKREAQAGARARGLSATCVAKARGRFQILWGIYQPGEGFVLES